YPEPVPDDNPFGRGPTCPMAGCADMRLFRKIMVADLVGIISCLQYAYAHAFFSLYSCARASRLARSIRSASSAWISNSDTSRHAKATNVTYAPASPSTASHQICQMSAKPVMVAKNAVTNPVALLRGISKGLYVSSGRAAARAFCFIPQYASSPSTLG